MTRTKVLPGSGTSYSIHSQNDILRTKALPLKKRHSPVYDHWSSSQQPPHPHFPLRTSKCFVPPKVRREGAKYVRFATTKCVVKIHSSKEDLENSWYSIVDYRYFDHERRRTVDAFARVQGNIAYLNPSEHTVSGLEQHLSRRQMVARKMHTRQHCHAVLQTQHFQFHCLGCYDPEALRNVSLLFSNPSAKRAHLRGMLEHSVA